MGRDGGGQPLNNGKRKGQNPSEQREAQEKASEIQTKEEEGKKKKSFLLENSLFCSLLRD